MQSANVEGLSVVNFPNSQKFSPSPRLDRTRRSEVRLSTFDIGHMYSGTRDNTIDVGFLNSKCCFAYEYEMSGCP